MSGLPTTAAHQRELRDAFGRFATGVVILTTRRDPDDWLAVTVNSFTSVSLDPPLLMFSLAKTANCLASFETCERFSASVLRHNQQWISSNFARPSESRWDRVPTQRSPEGDLLIEGALATFQCLRHARHDAGDHVLILGQIERFALRPHARPLAFFAGSYGSFTPDQADAPLASPGNSGVDDFTIGWG